MNGKMKTNSFYVLAEKYRKALTNEDEIEKIDMTEKFEREIRNMIKLGEIVIININGKMRGGKSTIGITIAKEIIYDELSKIKKFDKGFSMDNIARDEQEYSKKMRNPELNNNVIVVDESNALEGTGENVTAENALRKVFSDVQAGRYVHQVCCSPKETVDPNADVLLSVIAIDRINKITRCKLYYRYFEGGTEYTQILGFIDINVSETIKNWEEIKDIFLKPEKSKPEENLIKIMAKSDFYVEYIIKKYEKMELITKHGIMRPRMLEYATIILRSIEQIKSLTKISAMSKHVFKDILRSTIKINFRKEKIPTSLVGEELATREAMGIITLYQAYWEIQKEKNKLMKNKSSKIEPESVEFLLERLEEEQKQIGESIKLQEDELRRYININKNYHRSM